MSNSFSSKKAGNLASAISSSCRRQSGTDSVLVESNAFARSFVYGRTISISTRSGGFLETRSMTTTIRSLAVSLAFIGLVVVVPAAEAVLPPPDGCYPGFTTAEGCKALENLTTGLGNTAIGWYSLFTNTAGSYNTAVGAGALDL